jgi:N-acetyl-anhydromuramyl-L-alanine amidase AmpD
MNTPKYIIVHHTGGTDADPAADTSAHTFEIVDAWHRKDPNVWLGHYSSMGRAIGYHYFIEKNGRMTQGRADTDEGAHCKGHNLDSIGVCLAGNFDVTLPTEAQIAALKELLIKKTAQWSIQPSQVVPHRAFAEKTCYGTNLSYSWAQTLTSSATVPPVTSCQAEKDEIMELKEEVSTWKRAYQWIDDILKSVFGR